VTVAKGSHWKLGWDDIVPLIVVATPMVGWALLAGSHGIAELVVVGVALGIGLALKHLVPEDFEDLALLPVVVALLVEVSTRPLTVASLVLAAVAGVGLLLWAGAEPDSGVRPVQQLEPALIPALAVAVAVAVTFFLPGGTGGQVGLAALVLVVVLALSAWLYLQSAVETRADRSTP
jgi:hypothetical protein